MTFSLFQWKRLFSSFVTPDFNKLQNRNETSLKNRTKFTGIFASLVIKLQTPQVLKVQTRATIEQKMIPIKNEQFCNQKKHDLIIVRWSTYLASFRCYLGFSGVSLEMLKLQNFFFFSCFSKATIFSQILKWLWMSIFWRVYSIICLTCIYRTCKNVKRFLVFFSTM